MAFRLTLENFWIPKDGSNLLRILPPSPLERGEFYLEVPTHYDVTPECRALICQQPVHGSCLVERYMAQLLSSIRREDHAHAHRMQPVTRIQMNVHVLGTREVKIWSVSEGTLGKILSIIVDEGCRDLTHPTRGRDLRVLRTGEGPESRYTLHARPKPTPIQLVDWEDKLYNLEQEFRPPTNAEVWAILGDRMKKPRTKSER